jgi:iron complex outermembrane receptor protein
VKLDVLQAYEADGTSYGISSDVVKGQIAPDFTIVTKQTSDELQLIGKAVGGKLSYVTGLYYSDEKQAHRQFSQFFDLLLGGSSQFNHYNLLNTTIAGYGQGTYQLNDDGLSLTAGLRYTSEKVRVQYQSTDSTAVLCTIAPTVYKCDQSETFNKLSWQIGLQKQLNPNLLLYGVSRRAFKSGGYSGSQAPKIGFADVAGNGFKAEQVTDVEFGAKFQGYVGDLPARANVALFHDWVKDSQRTAYQVVSGNPAAITANVPKGKNYGLEFDGQIKTNDWLTLGGTLNFTHTEFGTDPINVNGSAGIYDQVPDSPKFSGTLFADMSIPVGGHYAVSLHGDVYNQAESFVSPQSINNVGTKIDSYTLANFRVGFEDAGAKWSITANLKNAFDKVYYVGAIPTGQIYQINIAVPGDPRTVTLEARFKF